MSEAIHQAERAVIGAMLLDSAAIDDATRILTAADFTDARHGEVFETISRLATAGGPHDVVAVTAALGARATRLDAPASLWGLVNGVVSTSSTDYYAGLVRDGSMRRTVAHVATEIAAGVEGDDTSALEVVNAARAKLDALVTDDDADTPNEAAVYKALESLDNPPGMPTPWGGLTRILAGWKPQAFYIVGARTSVGKSVIALNATLDMARRGKTAVMFSLEMSRDEVYLRMLSNVAGVDGSRIQHRELTDDHWQKLAKAAEHISSLPIVIDDRTGLSIAQIRSKVRTLQRTRDVGLVVVDYLGKVRPPSDTMRQDRRIQVDAIAWGHKEISRELNVPVVAMSQLNRNIEGRAEKMPTLSDLRESGGQEQDADVVILMHRAISEQHGDPSELHLHVAKNRHGACASMRMIFRGHYSRADEERNPFTNERHVA